MTPAKSDKKLTLKQRRWLKVYIETGNATEAAMQAYDVTDREDASKIGSENYRKLEVPALLEEMGLGRVRLFKSLDDGLGATKQLAARTGNSATAESDDFIEVPDYLARHKYMETGLKLHRLLIPEAQTINNIAATDMRIEFIQGDR